MYTMLRTGLLTSLVFIATAAPSFSAFIDLAVGTTGTGGSLSITSAGVVGTGITVTSAQGQGTASNAGVTAPITNGSLSFKTGALISTDAAGDQFYANGGTVTVTGTFQGFTGTLLSATFSGSNPIELQNLGNNTFQLLGGGLFGSASAALASYYNFDPTASNQGGFSLLLGGGGPAPTVNSGNLALTTNGTFVPFATVPEPASMSMLGIGLIGTLAIGRLRRSRAA